MNPIASASEHPFSRISSLAAAITGPRSVAEVIVWLRSLYGGELQRIKSAAMVSGRSVVKIYFFGLGGRGVKVFPVTIPVKYGSSVTVTVEDPHGDS
jgi:hypothetical protein